LSHSPAIPADNAPIPDDLPLFRLVPITQCEVVNGEWEFRSGAFDNTSGSIDMSVIMSDTLAALERTPDDLPERLFPKSHERWGVAVIDETRFLRDELGQEVLRTPDPEEPPEPAHGDVRGTKGPGRRKRIKKHATWVFRPPTPSPAES
jgi:hypothetical protein